MAGEGIGVAAGMELQATPPRTAALRLLLPYLRPYRGRVPLAAVAAAARPPGWCWRSARGVRHLVDEGFAAGSAAALDRTALLLFGVVAALAIATGGRFWLVSWLGERVAADLRRAVFEHVLRAVAGLLRDGADRRHPVPPDRRHRRCCSR